ncbi:MAG: hypothetical protein IT385_18485 [Deltaproteobacteria bacterium]|nr:hypothetical protein [Deltaproteobacteria bacterium]
MGWTFVLGACADDGALVVDGEPEAERSGLSLIGVSGRRLVDGDVYRVPLDFDDVAVAAGDSRREAFVVRNDLKERATVLSLAARGQGGADEWRVLAPIRARDVPLDARGIELPPGTRLDFDVAFAPAYEGERVARLELIVALEDTTDVRVVELRGECARAPP